MGSKCTTPRSKGNQACKTSKSEIVPSPVGKFDSNDFSFRERAMLFQTKCPSMESIPNVASLSTLSSRSKSALSDLGDETPKLLNINSPLTQSPPILDNLDMNKVIQYKKGPSIGKGFYGEVNECLNLSSGELLAAKSFRACGDLKRLQSYIEALKKEMAVLKTLSHPNVVKYHTIQVSESKDGHYSTIDIISEYVSGGSIKTLLDKFGKLDERVVSSYTKQVLEGLVYLHGMEIAHRNIKSSNILIDSCGTAKLTDFGCVKNLEKFDNTPSPEKNKKVTTLFKDAPYWSAPEVIMKKSQGKSSDIWSVGCVMLEMLTGIPSWKNLSSNPDQICKFIASGDIPPFPENISETCRDFLLGVFKFRPEERPTALELLEHNFIKEQIPSLSCLDLDSMQTFQIYQQNTCLKSLDLQDDIFCNQKKENIAPNDFPEPSIYDNLAKKNAELSIHVGQSKAIPNSLNKPVNSFTTLPSLKRIPSKSRQEENSLEISRTNTDPDAMTPGKKMRLDINYRCEGTIGRARLGSKTMIAHTPIKNSFFSNPNSMSRANDQSEKKFFFKDSFPNRLSSENKSIGTLNQEESDLCQNLDTSSAAKESLRKRFEEEMEAELAEMEAGNHYQFNQDEGPTDDQELCELRKMEQRRRYEQELEQELMGINMTQVEEK